MRTPIEEWPDFGSVATYNRRAVRGSHMRRRVHSSMKLMINEGNSHAHNHAASSAARALSAAWIAGVGGLATTWITRITGDLLRLAGGEQAHVHRDAVADLRSYEIHNRACTLRSVAALLRLALR